MSDIISERSSLDGSITVFRRQTTPLAVEQKKIRVAAYCRVSTESEKQESSLEIQMASYSKIISENPNWELVDIYKDQGITGTIATKRPGFQKMIKDAMAGKIDKILAKSISRFARNTVDALTYIRSLREKNIGVYFEKEKIDTMSMASEMMVTVFAAFAQEESHSNSENMKRGIRQRFQMGKPKYTATLGYDHDVRTNTWSINEEEAKTVRKIFEFYFDGLSTKEIAKELNKHKEYIGTHGQKDGKGKTWYSSAIHDILMSEKYIGDCQMQKFYTVDHLTHKHIRNDELTVEQYYKKNHHEAIVSREMHEAALQTIKLRNNQDGVSQYPFYGFLKCPCCGENLVKVSLASITVRKPTAWVCGGTGTKQLIKERSSCPRFSIRNENVEAALEEAFNKKGINKKPTYYHLLKNVKMVAFPSWTTMKVTWLDGTETIVTLPWELPNEHPYPIFKDVKGYPSRPKKELDGKFVTAQRAEAVVKERVEIERLIENTEVTFDGDIPLVKLKK